MSSQSSATRSEQPVQITRRRAKTDAQLVDPATYKKLQTNNQYLDPHNLKNADEVLMAIIQGHPLLPALTINVVVPAVYVQQFWRTVSYVPESEEDESMLEFRVDDRLCSVSLSEFRQMLSLPEALSRPPLQNFDEATDMEDVFTLLLDLGYTEMITQVSQFQRKNLPGIWYQAYGVIARCLTAIAFGQDKGTAGSLKMFIAFCFNQHIDYAQLIWNELIDCVRGVMTKKKERSYIPFPRFTQVLIRGMMDTFSDISRRPSSPVYNNEQMQTLRLLRDYFTEGAMRIPLSLLRYADVNNDAVEQYVVANFSDDLERIRQQYETRRIQTSHVRQLVLQSFSASEASPPAPESVSTPSQEEEDSELPESQVDILASPPVSPQTYGIYERIIDRQVSEWEAYYLEDKARRSEAKLSASRQFRRIRMRQNMEARLRRAEQLRAQRLHRSPTPESAPQPNSSKDKSHDQESDYDHDDDQPDFRVPSPPHVISHTVATVTSLLESPFLQVTTDVAAPLFSSVSAPPTAILTPSTAITTTYQRRVRDSAMSTEPIPTATTHVETTFSPLDSFTIHELQQHTITRLMSDRDSLVDRLLHNTISRDEFKAAVSDLKLNQTKIKEDQAKSLENQQRILDRISALQQMQIHLNAQVLAIQETQSRILQSQSSMASTVIQNSSDVTLLTAENSALNAKMQLLLDQIGDVDLSELCKSAAASFKRKHDDQEDPDLHEGEREPKRQRTEAAPSSTAPAPSSQQQEAPASTSGGKGKEKETVGVVEVHSSELEVSEPETPEIQSSTDDIVNQPVGDFRIPEDRINSLMINEAERQSVRDIRAQTKDLLAYQPPISEPILDEEEETSQVAEDPATQSSYPTPAISTGPSQSAVEPAAVSAQPSSPQQQEEEPITFTHEGELIHPGCANPRSDLWNPDFFFEHQGSPLPPTTTPPPAELPNENWAPFDIRSKRPIEPLTKVKSSRGKVNVEGDLGTKRNVWRDPYLEEECEKYYVHTKRTIRFQNLWGIKHWTRDQRLRFWTLLHTQRSHRNAVVSDSKIELLNNVTISWIRGIRYSTYYAERFDQSKVVFNDFDFEYLQIDDVHTVYKELCRFTNQNWVIRAAKENVEMYIKLRCRTAMLFDFQMALEARQERVNETRPNLFFDEVDSIQTLTVLQRPEFGIVYQNEAAKENRFLRFREIHKFCDGTLEVIYRDLYKLVHSPPTRASRLSARAKSQWEIRKSNAMEAMELIKAKRQERMVVRRLEAILKIRAFDWSSVVKDDDASID